MKRFRLPSPAMAVAVLALFIALGGTSFAAVEIVPLAKRALVANNALKLNGQTLNQIVAGIGAAVPALLSVQIQPWSLNPGTANQFTVSCPAGQKAVSGGFNNTSSSAFALAFDTHPSSDESGWMIVLANASSSAAATGNVYAVCVA
jgi:hypothetical protein